MLLKYIDLHNKTLRDAKDPLETAKVLLDHCYFIVGVTVNNDANEIKGREHFYHLFEEYFEKFEKAGLLILPAVELKVRRKGESLDKFVDLFSRKYIPVKVKGKIHHLPFLILVHGGDKEVNTLSVSNPKVDILCHPEKDEGYFSVELAEIAAKNGVGIEVNHREFMKSSNQEHHKNKVLDIIGKVKRTSTKLFLATAAIDNDDLVPVHNLVTYGNDLHPELALESAKNIIELVVNKYGMLLEDIEFDLELVKKKHHL